MKVLAISQARVSSSRLPGKIFKEVTGTTLLEIHIQRLLESKRITDFILATTQNPADDIIEAFALERKLTVFRGQEEDVLDRFYCASQKVQPDWIVRVTSDCPLIDAKLIDEIVDRAITSNADYVSNTLEPTFPDGQDVEVFKIGALETAWRNAVLRSDREHVTPYIWRNSTFKGKEQFKSFNFNSATDYSRVRLTVDEQRDFETLRFIIENLGYMKGWLPYAQFYLDHLNEIENYNIQRNEGFERSLLKDHNHGNKL